MGSAKQVEKELMNAGSSIGRTIESNVSGTVTSLEELTQPQLAANRRKKEMEKGMASAAEQAKIAEIEARKQTVQSIYESIGKRKKGSTLLTQTGQQVGPRFSDQQSISTLLTGGRSGNV